MLKGLSQNEFDQLYLSVGSHRSRRPLSPIEVGRFCALARAAGESNKRIAAALALDGPSMVGRFLKVLQLDQNMQHLVEWGETSYGVIGFSTAVEVVLVPQAQQERMANAVCEFGLNKTEARSVRQLLERSKKALRECVDDVVKRRAVIVVREVIVGAVLDEVLIGKLEGMLQSERDTLLGYVIGQLYPSMEPAAAKLGTSRFTVIGGESVRDTIGEDANFESNVSRHLAEKACSDVA